MERDYTSKCYRHFGFLKIITQKIIKVNETLSSSQKPLKTGTQGIWLSLTSNFCTYHHPGPVGKISSLLIRSWYCRSRGTILLKGCLQNKKANGFLSWVPFRYQHQEHRTRYQGPQISLPCPRIKAWHRQSATRHRSETVPGPRAPNADFPFLLSLSTNLTFIGVKDRWTYKHKHTLTKPTNLEKHGFC